MRSALKELKKKIEWKKERDWEKKIISWSMQKKNKKIWENLISAEQTVLWFSVEKCRQTIDYFFFCCCLFIPEKKTSTTDSISVFFLLSRCAVVLQVFHVVIAISFVHHEKKKLLFSLFRLPSFKCLPYDLSFTIALQSFV